MARSEALPPGVAARRRPAGRAGRAALLLLLVAAFAAAIFLPGVAAGASFLGRGPPPAPPAPAALSAVSLDSLLNAQWRAAAGRELLDSARRLLGVRPLAVTPAPRAVSAADLNRQRLLAQVNLKNSLVLWAVPARAKASLPHFVQSWLANYVMTVGVYFITGGLWCAVIYRGMSPDRRPSWAAIAKQMVVSMRAIPFYSLLPPTSEWFMLNGYTRCYAQIQDVGWPAYIGYMCLYMFIVEFWVYWMHRGLHDFKPGYKYLHHIHHIYNKENTLSPFAGLAFHPLDGILQAAPYAWTTFFVPVHYLTHEVLLFCTGIWTTNIHDNIDGQCEPIMGAGYHLIHHTTYKHNYGHYTILWDWFYNTLRSPAEDEAIQAGRAAATPAQAKKAKKGN